VKCAILFYDEPVAFGDLDEASLQEMYADYDNLGPSEGGELRRGVYPPTMRALACALATHGVVRDICGISGV
jgi:hypothetical protein